MGGCVGKSKARTHDDAALARRLQQEELRNANQPLIPNQRGGPPPPNNGRGGSRGGSNAFVGQGQLLGGDVQAKAAEDRRQLQLEAAEARAKATAGRGGVSEKRAKELEEAQVKDDLIGKIQAYCAMRKKEEPMGLRLASVPQLQETLRNLQSGV
ncbi:unnamed protein product [Amoebophrya sp. A120]|nr:unnamed protein product [Amoebophrya sp. A120]|eukprot:GSA120T00004970001.1